MGIEYPGGGWVSMGRPSSGYTLSMHVPAGPTRVSLLLAALLSSACQKSGPVEPADSPAPPVYEDPLLRGAALELAVNDPELTDHYEGLPGWSSMFPPSVNGDGLRLASDAGAGVGLIRNNLALFLGSEDASYVSGALIPVDGGISLLGARNHAVEEDAP